MTVKNGLNSWPFQKQSPGSLFTYGLNSFFRLFVRSDFAHRISLATSFRRTRGNHIHMPDRCSNRRVIHASRMKLPQDQISITNHAILRCAQRFLGFRHLSDTVQPGSPLWHRCRRSILRIYEESDQQNFGCENDGTLFFVHQCSCLVLQGSTVITVYRSNGPSGFSKEWLKRRRIVKKMGIEDLEKLLQKRRHFCQESA